MILDKTETYDNAYVFYCHMSEYYTDDTLKRKFIIELKTLDYDTVMKANDKLSAIVDMCMQKEGMAGAVTKDFTK